MDQSLTKVIEIESGNEYRVLVDNIYDSEKFFYPVYRKSSELINEIYENNLKKNAPKFNSFPNNIIMYCAERGGGKSSAMASFSEALKSLHSDKIEKIEDFTNSNNQWKTIREKCFFSILDVIDPTLIGEKEMFMRVVLSRMFSMVSRYWDELDSKKNREDSFFESKNHDRVDLVNKFKKCCRLIDVIYQKDENRINFDDLDELADLGDSSHLRNEFSELVNLCLANLHGINMQDDNKCFLVIQLDDTDLNTKMAYNIIEDIRKYCIIPHVVILMAVDINQMSNVIEQHFVSDFKTLLDMESRIDMGNIPDYHNMAEKYIDKVMPAGHQIHLPRIDDFIRSNIFALTVKYMVKTNDQKNEESAFYDAVRFDNIVDYQERLIRLIFNKTGLVLVKPQGQVHNLLPTTFRDLAHFLSYVNYLPDLDNGDTMSNVYRNENFRQDEIEKRINNLDAFEQFFVHNWCRAQLSKPHFHVLFDLTNISSTKRVTLAIECVESMLTESDKTDENSGNKGIPSPNSFALLQERINRLVLKSNSVVELAEVNKFAYALRFYFMLFFNKEFLLCVLNRNSPSSLCRSANYEFWAPVNLRAAEYGYFEVNYNILSKYGFDLFKESDQNVKAFKDGCYININGVNHTLDREDPHIRAAISSITQTPCTDNSPKIFYNICYEMLNHRNMEFYPLAFSHDLQDWIESSGVRADLNDNNFRYGRNALIRSIANGFDNIKYLPLELNDARIGENVPVLQKLQLSNYNLAVEFVKYSFAEINYFLDNISFPKARYKTENSDAPFRIIRYLLILRDNVNSLEILSAISNEVEQLCKNCKEVLAHFGELDEFTIIPINDMGEQVKYKKEMYTALQGIREPFENWKKYVKAPGTLKKITDEIQKAFDEPLKKKRTNTNKRASRSGGTNSASKGTKPNTSVDKQPKSTD